MAAGRILVGKAAAAEEEDLGSAVRVCGVRELRKREVRVWEGKAGRERRWAQSYWYWTEAEARWSAVGRSPDSVEESAARRRWREWERCSAHGCA